MIRVEQLVKIFHRGSVNENAALAGVDLHVADGEFVTIIGSNGAGKSSLLNAVAGMWPVDAGSIRIDGREVTKLLEHRRARDIGRVFQDPLRGTAGAMTVEENLALAARRGMARGLRWGVRSADREAFRDALRQLNLGLENRLGDPVGLLSGGQRQSITLLMATLRRPRILLLDEHTAALDPKTAHVVMALTDLVVERDRLTTLMVTHNMDQALRHGNRTVMMHRGRVILDVSGDERETLTVKDLLDQFHQVRGDDEESLSDRMLLA